MINPLLICSRVKLEKKKKDSVSFKINLAAYKKRRNE